MSHFFIKGLDDNGQLLRNFTQNIDTLEEVAGIHNVVYCHGSFATATCLQCRRKYTCDELRERMGATGDAVPYCDDCVDGDEAGVIKPDIVFFGEPLPSHFDEHLERDVDVADLVIVIGSSMKVQPVSMIPDLIHPNVPQILINKERLDHHFDIELIGEADLILAEIARRLGSTQLGPYSFDGAAPETLFVEPNVTVFSGSQLGGRPPIPEPFQDGSLLALALESSEPSVAIQHLTQEIFPVPE